VDLCEDDPKFEVRVILKAERFRSSKEIVELADRFVAENPPNWEVRE
jgi:superfamily I DNA/RNA helicase